MPPPSGRGSELRATRVGASEVGALMGNHPFVTPSDIWARVLGKSKPKPENDAMRLGTFLEESVANLWARETGRKVVKCSRTYAVPDVPLVATPDYYVPHHELLECKTSSNASMWSSLPDHVWWQAQAQLLATGRRVCHVAVLLGSHLRMFQVEASGIAQSDLIDTITAFWRNHVEPRIPPDDASAQFSLRYQAPPEGVVKATEDDEAAASLLSFTTDLIKNLEGQAQELRETLAGSLLDGKGSQLFGSNWTFTRDSRGVLTFRANKETNHV